MCLLQVWYRCVLINIHVGHVWDRCILINRKKVAVHVVLPWLHTRGGPHLAQAKRCEQQSGLLLLAAKLKLPQTNTLRMGEIKSCSPLFNHQTRQSQHAFTAFPFDSTHMGSFFLQGWLGVPRCCFCSVPMAIDYWQEARNSFGSSSITEMLPAGKRTDRRNGIIPSCTSRGREFPLSQSEGSNDSQDHDFPASSESLAYFTISKEENDAKPFPSCPFSVPWNWDTSFSHHFAFWFPNDPLDLNDTDQGVNVNANSRIRVTLYSQFFLVSVLKFWSFSGIRSLTYLQRTIGHSSFIHSSSYPSVHSFIHSSIHAFIHSFVDSFIHILYALSQEVVLNWLQKNNWVLHC